MKQSRYIFAALVAALPYAAAASADLCETHAASAAQRHGVPPDLMRAIARMESGRAVGGGAVRAWPWTANVAGQGFYFDTSAEALAHLETVRANGQTSFDVGCMQLNYRWHGDQFASLSQMIEPARNTDYAARYLSDLYTETGDWDMATRYYHSRTASHGATYLAGVRRIKAGMGDEPQRNTMPQRGPIISVAAATPYWQVGGLGESALPRMPD